MSGRRSARSGSRRSSLSAAVPFATDSKSSDRSVTVTEQLKLAMEVDVPRPQLVVAVVDADNVTGMGNQPSPPELQLAELGEVLAKVLEFHEAFGLPREPLPTAHVGDTLAQLRVRLLREEVEEFADATEQRDLVAIADALADVVYVAYGSAATYGIDLDSVVREVHRSNMSKLDAKGRPVLREDGKVLKSERYRPPHVGHVIDEQLPLFGPDGPTPGASASGASAAAS